jgi:hypothetical protein
LQLIHLCREHLASRLVPLGAVHAPRIESEAFLYFVKFSVQRLRYEGFYLIAIHVSGATAEVCEEFIDSRLPLACSKSRFSSVSRLEAADNLGTTEERAKLCGDIHA